MGITHREKEYTTLERVMLPLERTLYSSDIDISQSHRNIYILNISAISRGR